MVKLNYLTWNQGPKGVLYFIKVFVHNKYSLDRISFKEFFGSDNYPLFNVHLLMHFIIGSLVNLPRHFQNVLHNEENIRKLILGSAEMQVWNKKSK